MKVLSIQDEPITLASAKLAADITSTYEDSILTSKLAAAVRACENYARAPINNQIVQEIYQNYDNSGVVGPSISQKVRLSYGPVNSVTSVTLVYNDGTTEVVAAEKYVLNAATKMLYRQNWQPTKSVDNIIVVYTAGYDDLANVPDDMQQAVMICFYYLVENRGLPADADMQRDTFSPIPVTAQGLLAAYRNAETNVLW